MLNTKNDQIPLWSSRIQDFEDSCLSIQEWCKGKEIPVSTFGYWRRKVKKIKSAASGPNWLRVDTNLDSSIGQLKIPLNKEMSAAGVITVKYAEFTVEIPYGCSPQQTFEMLKMLRAL